MAVKVSKEVSEGRYRLEFYTIINNDVMFKIVEGKCKGAIVYWRWPEYVECIKKMRGVK